MIRSTLLVLTMVVAILGFSFASEARNLDLKNDRVAPFLRGSFGYCLAGTSAFGASSGADTTFDKSANFSTGGEIGVAVEGSSIGMRLSVEYLIPKQLTSAEGIDASGTKQMSLESKMAAVIPQVNFDYNFHGTNTSRWFFGGGVGMATLSLDNVYTITGSKYSSLGSTLTESGKGNTMGGQAYLGYEGHFTDTVTLSLDIGYRYYTFQTIESTKTETSFTGSEVEGQPLKNHDGSDRQINLSGPYSALMIRFYL